MCVDLNAHFASRYRKQASRSLVADVSSILGGCEPEHIGVDCAPMQRDGGLDVVTNIKKKISSVFRMIVSHS